MTCDDFRPWISLAADGRLDAARQDELRSHLAACASCRSFEAQLHRGRALLGNLPSSGNEAFTQAVLKKAARRRPRAWVAAAAVLLVGIATYLAIGRRAPPEPVDASRRDRAWMVLVQVARDPRSQLRQEIEDARLNPDDPLLKRPLEEERPRTLPATDAKVDSPDPFRRARQLMFAGRAEEAVAAFRACLEAPEETDRRDDALHWIAFIEARRGRAAESLGAYLSLSMIESPWFDAAARREAQRLALAREGQGPLALWIPKTEEAGEWVSVPYTPGAAWCVLESAGGNKGGKDAPVALELGGRMLRASSAADFAARYPEELKLLKVRFPEILEFIEVGMLEIQLEDPHPPHGP